jgi:hypothetical protein
MASLLVVAHAEESRIQRIDSLGNIQHNKPSLFVQRDGKIYETDPYGNQQYHHQQHHIKGEKVYQTDAFGNIQYHKL